MGHPEIQAWLDPDIQNVFRVYFSVIPLHVSASSLEWLLSCYMAACCSRAILSLFTFRGKETFSASTSNNSFELPSGWTNLGLFFSVAAKKYYTLSLSVCLGKFNSFIVLDQSGLPTGGGVEMKLLKPQSWRVSCLLKMGERNGYGVNNPLANPLLLSSRTHTFERPRLCNHMHFFFKRRSPCLILVSKSSICGWSAFLFTF